MTQQPEALRLADRLDLYATGDAHQQDIEQAAAELRRLHDLCAEWERKAATWLASPEAAKRLDGYRELAQPEQEPVAHVYLFEPNGRPRVAWDNAKDIKIGDKLYTTPPQGIYYTPPQRKPRQWQGLARLEFQKAVEGLEDLEDCWIAIESALREKNT